MRVNSVCLSCLTAIQASERFLDTDMLKTLGPKSISRLHPSCLQHANSSADYWECYVRHSAFPLSHFSGTCKMGAVTDPTAVVDPELR